MEYKFSEKLKSLKPSAIREILKSLSDPSVISFAAGNPAASAFPADDVARLSAEIFRDCPITALQYNITEGYAPLRESVAAKQRMLHGIGRDFDETIIVSGGQQGLELACKAFCDTGDAVLCEDPSFIGALNAFRSVGAAVTGVSMEQDGICISDLEQKLKNIPNIKLIYLIPTFQNPTGLTMSLEKRKRVLELAKAYDAIIIEDNPYDELRFSGKAIPTIKSFDTEGHVIYVSSFSKILSPGLRVGTVTAHRDIIPKMVVAKQGEDVHTSILSQLICHRFMSENGVECGIPFGFDAHLEMLRNLYGEKYRLMRDCLSKEMPDSATFSTPEGGLFIWGTLGECTDESKFISEAIARKVAVVPGSAFMCAPDKIPDNTPLTFRLNYSTPTEAEIKEGCKRLGDAARAVL